MARKQMERGRAISKARKSGDWDAVMKMIDKEVAAAPERSKASLLVNKFQLLLTDANKPADGYKLGREIAAANKDNAMVLNQMAWFLLDNPKVKDPDLQFALEIAQQAVDANKGDSSVIDTLARAYWETGNKAKAIEWQKKAVEKAPTPMIDDMKETLKKYEGSDAPTATKKTSFFMDDAPATKQADAPAAPATKPADAAPAAPAAPVAPAAPRAPRPAAKLTAAAEKTFPAVDPMGFDSTDAIVAFLPEASKSAEGVQRLVRAMRSTNDSAEVPLMPCTMIATPRGAGSLSR
jgi:tetratricopeptide (TPR) repeat protein